MKGQILDADGAARSGLILGDDGNRYRFSGDDWKPGTLPRGGVRVDFVNEGELAREIFAIPGQPGMEPLAAAAPTSSVITAPGDRSVLWGGAGIACLVLTFVIPPLPLIGSLAFGLIGTGIAKKTGNGTGLVLGRISWVGSLILGLLLAALLTWAVIFAWPFLEVLYLYFMASFAPPPTTA